MCDGNRVECGGVGCYCKVMVVMMIVKVSYNESDGGGGHGSDCISENLNISRK